MRVLLVLLVFCSVADGQYVRTRPTSCLPSRGTILAQRFLWEARVRIAWEYEREQALLRFARAAPKDRLEAGLRHVDPVVRRVAILELERRVIEMRSIPKDKGGSK